MESPPPEWRESSGGLRPTWGNAAARSMAGLRSSSPHLAPGTAAEGAPGAVLGARHIPSPHLHRPGRARWPGPPLAYLV